MKISQPRRPPLAHPDGSNHGPTNGSSSGNRASGLAVIQDLSTERREVKGAIGPISVGSGPDGIASERSKIA